MYNVVIADDEPIICDYMAQVLSALPAIQNIYQFNDGQEAYTFLEKNRVDICLLDVSMPGKTGLDIADLIHSQNNGTCILLISAYRDFSFAQRAIRCGVRGYLTKPFPSQALQQLVSECIEDCNNRSVSKENRWNVLRDFIALLVKSDSAAKDISQILLCDGSLSLSDAVCTEVCIHIPSLPNLTDQDRDALLSQLRLMSEHNNARQACICLQKSPNAVVLLFFSSAAPDLALVGEVAGILAPHNFSEYTVKISEADSFSGYLKRITFEKKMDAFWRQLSALGILAAQDTVDVFLQAADSALTADFARYLEKCYNLNIDPPDRNTILTALSHIVKQKRSHGGGNHHLIAAVQDYIDCNYQAAWLSLEAAANSLNVSPEHLSRTFKKITGQNFSDYLVKYRIQKAIALLMEDRLSIKQISENVGFSNTAYFRSCFKTHCGITPTQYRKLRTRKEKEAL